MLRMQRKYFRNWKDAVAFMQNFKRYTGLNLMRGGISLQVSSKEEQKFGKYFKDIPDLRKRGTSSPKFKRGDVVWYHKEGTLYDGSYLKVAGVGYSEEDEIVYVFNEYPFRAVEAQLTLRTK